MFYRYNPLFRVDTLPLYISHNFPPSGDRPGAECLQTRRYCMPPEVPKRVQGTVLPLGHFFPTLVLVPDVWGAPIFSYLPGARNLSQNTRSPLKKDMTNINAHRVAWIRHFSPAVFLKVSGVLCAIATTRQILENSCASNTWAQKQSEKGVQETRFGTSFGALAARPPNDARQLWRIAPRRCAPKPLAAVL